MQRQHPLTDYEAHYVRENPERSWPADVVAEAEDRDRLPIDAAFDLPDHDPEPWQHLTASCWAGAIGMALAIIAAFVILGVLL